MPAPAIPITTTKSTTAPRRRPRKPIRVWAMMEEIPKALFLLPKLLHEAATQEEHDAWMRCAWPDPKRAPGNLVIGPYSCEQACERWNKYRD